MNDIDPAPVSTFADIALPEAASTPAPALSKTGLPGASWGQYYDETALEAMVVSELSVREVLEVLLRRASKHADPARRTRELTALDRALSDPETGYLRRLRQVRTDSMQERLDNGRATIGELASEAGVTTTRIRQILLGNPGYISKEREAELDARASEGLREHRRDVAAARAARRTDHAALLGRRAAERAERGHAIAARLDAGERDARGRPITTATIAAEMGVSRQTVTALVTAARRAAAARVVQS